MYYEQWVHAHGCTHNNLRTEVAMCFCANETSHYDDVIMTMLASQITSLTVVYSIVYSDVNQRKHQSSASLAFVREIHRGPVNFPHKWPVTRKMFPFDDVIMHFHYFIFVSQTACQISRRCLIEYESLNLRTLNS